MTKIARIENADTNYSKIIVVEYWENGNCFKMEQLTWPTQQISFTLWDGLELRVREMDNPSEKVLKASQAFTETYNKTE